MNLIDLMYKRRSTRKFSDEEISKEDLELILESALLAPTAMNRKPCEFIVVSNKETLKELSESKDMGAKLIAGANNAIVVIADGNLADTWVEDSSIALTHMHLMATELDIGSCWVQVHLKTKADQDCEDVVRDILNLDSHYRIVGILALGHSNKTPRPYTPEDLDKSKIRYID